MPANCPNCKTLLRRQEDGEYPSRCPACGVRIKSKEKSLASRGAGSAKAAPSTAAPAPPPAPAPPKNSPAPGERVIRSFSLAGQRPPLPTPGAAADPAAVPVPEADNPFDRSE